MSSKLVNNGSPLHLVNDEVVLNLKITRSGKIELQAPAMHPRDVCKMLSNLSYDLMYASLQAAEMSKIQPPMV